MPLSYTFDPVRPFIDRPQCPNCRSRSGLTILNPMCRTMIDAHSSVPAVSTSKVWW